MVGGEGSSRDTGTVVMVVFMSMVVELVVE